jgi:hypothetical protein
MLKFITSHLRLAETRAEAKDGEVFVLGSGVKTFKSRGTAELVNTINTLRIEDSAQVYLQKLDLSTVSGWQTFQPGLGVIQVSNISSWKLYDIHRQASKTGRCR